MSNSDMDKKDPNLTFLTNEELLKELIGRFDAFVIGGVRFCGENQETFVLKKTMGHQFVCFGLIEQLKDQVKKTSIDFPSIEDIKDR